MNQAEIDAGEAAFKAWVHDKWGVFGDLAVPETAELGGTELIIETMDAKTYASDQEMIAACAAAMYQKVVESGNGDRVSLDDCKACASEVIAAVQKVRQQEKQQ